MVLLCIVDYDRIVKLYNVNIDIKTMFTYVIESLRDVWPRNTRRIRW